ncbi:hypothetical protein D6C77_09436, partial [Aureobasidium pullulans]
DSIIVQVDRQDASIEAGRKEAGLCPQESVGLSDMQVFRRVKCDERRPHCRRCTSTGRKCDYDSSLSPQSVTSGTSVTENPVSNPRLSPCLDEQEGRALDFFRSVTLPQVAGTNHRDFWGKLILQGAHFDEATYHALLALSSVHENYVTGKDAGARLDAFALRQYNMAIRDHLDVLTVLSRSDEVERPFILPCSIIFICIELMQNHFKSAIFLLKNIFTALSMLQARDKEKSLDHIRTGSTDQELLLSRLQFQARALVGPKWGHTYRLRPIIAHAEIPSSFSSVGEAKDCFHTQTYIHGPSGKTKDSPEKPDWPSRYKTALDAYLSSHTSPLSLEDNHRLRLIEIHLLTIPLVPKLNGPNSSSNLVDEMHWDQYTSTFSKILDLVASTVYDLDTHLAPSFSLDFGIIGPLGILTSRCRDPSLRRKAIHLLRIYNRQEGMWHSSLTANVAERLVKIEEAGLVEVEHCRDIPLAARVSEVRLYHDLDQQQVMLCYSRQQSAMESVRIHVQEKIAYW